MDYAIKALLLLKKYHFWILVVVVLVVGAGLWTKASADLARQYVKHKSELTNTRTLVLKITGESNPPNDLIIDAIKKANQGLKGNVWEAWKYLWSLQQQNNPWPPELESSFLSTIKAVNEDADIPSDLRMIYWRFIGRHLPKLDEIIDRRKPKLTPSATAAEAGATAPGGVRVQPAVGATDTNTVLEGNVLWLDAEQVKQQFVLTEFPSSLRVRLVQEDLWVYRALLRIIKNTNEGTTSYSNAAIKAIERLEIGRRAAPVFQKREGVGAMGSGGSGPSTGPAKAKKGMISSVRMGAIPQNPAAVTSRSTSAQDVSSEDREKVELYQDRYLDQKGKPLPAGAAWPFAEFKMMPVHMMLIIHQTKIPKFLVECANSSMPVEVQRITITSLGQTSQAASGSPGGATWANRSASDSDDYGGNFLRVSVLGIIYIFNPPDQKKLGTGSAGELTTGNTTPPTASPATSQDASATGTPIPQESLEKLPGGPTVPTGTNPAAPTPARPPAGPAGVAPSNQVSNR